MATDLFEHFNQKKFFHFGLWALGCLFIPHTLSFILHPLYLFPLSFTDVFSQRIIGMIEYNP